MLGAIAGDVIGSVYEGTRRNVKTPYFYPLFDPCCRPTDDTVLTVAVADSLLHGDDLTDKLKEYVRLYPRAGYGGNFLRWALSLSRAPYGSYGNGSAMRVSPVGHAYPNLETVLHHAKRTAEVTHNHPEGIKGAQATAACVFLARTGASKEDIRDYVARTFHYDLDRSLDAIRAVYTFDVSCQGSVPEAIIAFLESTDYEDAVRKAISLGGDSDTIACITGGIAEAFYGEMPPAIWKHVWDLLDPRVCGIVHEFLDRYLPGWYR
ncbi:MAG: ADP-ribosylglycohydrolase family protein [Planctomycetes bacterium]|nr:ADP-ribosylglycohydrolase family protein [Planctomycetota bacterium]